MQARRPEPDELAQVLRRATEADVVLRFKHEQREREAYRIGVMKIHERGLLMKLSRVEQTFDGSRLIFYFTADNRVDFRELVRDLAAEFRTRIEMRQIGVRDEARLLGGYGSCGRPLCCTTWLQTFESVSIKMAKQQNLSLKPSKLSGLCGRLKCCLRYELPERQGRHPRRLRARRRLRRRRLPGRRELRRQRLREVRVGVRPRVALTVGDPAGIGPEIVRKAAADPRVVEVCEPVALRSRRRPRRSQRFPSGPAVGRGRPRRLRRDRRGGRRTRSAGASTPSPPRRSTRRRSRWPGCRGRATPTCSAHLTGAPRAVMMFDSPTLRVSLATVHIPLARRAARADDATCSTRRFAITAASLPDFGVARPRLAVAGLNPHAGEHGLMGDEDDRVLAPVVAALRAPTGSTSPGRFPATPSSCARPAASSTRSSPAITIRG